MSWNNPVVWSNQVGGVGLDYTAIFSAGGTVQENDLVVVIGSGSGDEVNAATVTMPVGWTQVYQYSSVTANDSAVFVFYAIAGAGGSIPELTVSRVAGERHYFRALAYRHTAGAPEFKSFAVQENIAASGVASLIGGINAPYTDALVISAIGSGSTTTANGVTSTGNAYSADSSTSATVSITPPDSEWTQRYNFTTSAGRDSAFATADTVISNDSTGDITWTKNTTGAKSTVVAMVFSPAGASPLETAINFAGDIPNQTFTEGQEVSIDLTTGRFDGTDTPFTYVNTGTLLTGTGLTISGAGLLSGTATVGSSAAVVITGTDAGLNTAVSNAFSVTVDAAVYGVTSDISFGVEFFSVSAAQSSTEPGAVTVTSDISIGVPFFSVLASQQVTIPEYQSTVSFGVPIFSVDVSEQLITDGSSTVAFSVPLFGVSANQASTVTEFISAVQFGVPMFSVEIQQKSEIPSGGATVSFSVPLFGVSVNQESTLPQYDSAISFGVPFFSVAILSGEFDYHASPDAIADIPNLSRRVDMPSLSRRIDI